MLYGLASRPKFGIKLFIHVVVNNLIVYIMQLDAFGCIWMHLDPLKTQHHR